MNYLRDDTQPLPFIISSKCQFKLAFVEIDEKIYYSIQDWIRGLTDANPRMIWADIRRRNETILSQMQIKKLPYVTTDNKTYQMDFTDDEGLYLLVQHLRVTRRRPLLDEIKRFLAESGAFVDLIRREPENITKLIGSSTKRLTS
jgi:hypothetical protein